MQPGKEGERFRAKDFRIRGRKFAAELDTRWNWDRGTVHRAFILAESGDAFHPSFAILPKQERDRSLFHELHFVRSVKERCPG